MKKTQQTTTLYTEQEKKFLESTLSLLEIEFNTQDAGMGTAYEFVCTDDEMGAVAWMMKANFMKNYA